MLCQTDRVRGLQPQHNRRSWEASLVLARSSLAVLLMCCFAAAANADLLVSVDFNSPNPFTASPTFSGVESAAAAADSVFGAANVWNGLNVTFGVDTNPSWNGLVNSSGAATSVNFSVTGSVGGASLYDPVTNPDALRADFLGFNTATFPGLSTSISWQITGLAANTAYDMCMYGAEADVNRSFDITIGNTTQNVPTFITGTQAPSCVLFKGILSDSSGAITGIGTGVGAVNGFLNEANWSGFQIATTTPEPSSLLLLGTGLLSLGGAVRRKLFG
jgi:hypothetical protein